MLASDMPHTKNGIRPDIILNPNAIPSRMTIGQMWECIFGKVGALSGTNMDGTSFENYDLNEVQNKLEKMGYERNGLEYLYNGFTGEKIPSMIFIGPTYYQRLKHMVKDKIHARAKGPVTSIARQAPDGRARDGGLKLGEMEVDSLCAHGAAKLLKEKLYDLSDAYIIYVCGICGLFAQRNKSIKQSQIPSNNDTMYCPVCNNSTNIHPVAIPYAFKQMIHELMAMNIAARIRVKD